LILFDLLATFRVGRWKSPVAAVIPNSHLPMRSLEAKNRLAMAIHTAQWCAFLFNWCKDARFWKFLTFCYLLFSK